MTETPSTRYDRDDLVARIPRDRGEYFAGWVPGAEVTEGWRAAGRQDLAAGHGRPTVRTVWEDPESPERRVAVDLSECAGAEEAAAALAERLEWNQAASLPAGPDGLGWAAFVHPDNAPPAVFFVRGNLAVAVVSYGSRPVEVLPWAERLNRELGGRPDAAGAQLALSVDTETAEVGRPLALSYGIPTKPGGDVRLEVFVTGGTIERRGDRLLVTPTRAGELTVEAWALGEGRYHGGRLTLPVR